jgi:hypothetical protein
MIYPPLLHISGYNLLEQSFFAHATQFTRPSTGAPAHCQRTHNHTSSFFNPLEVSSLDTTIVDSINTNNNFKIIPNLAKIKPHYYLSGGWVKKT